MKVKTTVIKATSRCSVKVGDSFYTLEYGEERTVEYDNKNELEKARESLWDDVNGEVDKQVEDVLKMYKK